MIPSQNNISFALIGKNVAAVTDGTLVNGIDTLLDGQIALVDIDNKAKNGDTIVATDVLRFVQRSGNDLVYTPKFVAKDATVRLTSYTNPSEQVSFIGYNGSSGSIDTTANNAFGVWLNFPQLNGTPLLKDFWYQSLASTSQAAITTGLYSNALANFSKIPLKNVVKFERVNSQTTSVALGTATVAKLTKGSKTVYVYTKAAAGNTTLTASTTSRTVGDVISVPTTNGKTFSFTAVALGSGAGRHVVYIGTTAYDVADGGTNAQNATAIAAAINAGTQATAAVTSSTTVTITYLPSIYGTLPPLVISSDDDSTFTQVTVTVASGDSVPVYYTVPAATSSAATFDLDYEWAGETGYVYSGTSAAINIGTITATAYYGIKITGLPQTLSINKNNYKKITFGVILRGFTSTTTTGGGVNSIGVAANEGKGTYEQVAEYEAFSDYNLGKVLREYYLSSDALTLDATSGVKYEIATINAKKYTPSLNSDVPSPFTINLCFYKDSGQGDQMATDLNTYYSSGAFSA